MLTLYFLISAPPAPTNVQIQDIESHRMHISWVPPDPTHGVLDQYRVIYRESGGDRTRESSHKTQGAVTEQWIEELKEFTEYEIQVGK